MTSSAEPQAAEEATTTQRGTQGLRGGSESQRDRKAERKTVRDDLPPALSSMWRLCKLGYRHEPSLMLVAFVLSLLAALPDALLALWLMLLGEGVVDGRFGQVTWAAI